MLWRSRVFSTVFYLVRTKNIKQVRVAFLQGFKKKKEQTSMYTATQYDLGTWEGILIKGVPALASQEEGRSIYTLNMGLLYF